MGILIGIDLGTSSLKAVALKGGAVLASASEPIQTRAPQPGWSEQDPKDWVQAADRALCALTAKIAADEVVGISLSGQMHGLVLLDAEHVPVMPALLWNDNRAVAQTRQLMDEVPDLPMRAGVPALPGFNAPKLRWLRDTGVDLGAVRHTLLPKDFVGLWLHGQMATDISDAAGTLWFYQKQGTWAHDLVAASGCDPDWLPPLHAGSDQIGQLRSSVATRIGLPSGIPVFAGAGDAAAGAVGVGAVRPGRATLSLGTSAQVFLCADSYRPNPDQFLHAFAHTLPGHHYQMAALLNGARPLAWLGRLLGLSAAEVAACAQTADPTRAPLFLPYLTGERSPHGDPNLRAQFHGLDDATTRDELCYAALEGIAFSLADGVASFGHGLDHCRATGDDCVLTLGGGTRSGFLLQLVADATGLVLGQAEASDAAAAIGAARLAGLGCGALAQTDLETAPPVKQRYAPDPAPHLAGRLARFRGVYRPAT